MNREQIASLEGGSVALFMVDTFKKYDIDLQNKKVLEIGPKHGLHTMMIDEENPESITCVELINKKALNETWSSRVKNNLTFNYTDILRFQTDNKFNVIICSGVIYHNTEQLRILKKLWSVADEDCILVIESSTTRNPDLINENVIEIHWPETYRNVAGVIFHPSKKALISMLDMSGWETIETTDSNITPEACNPERITVLCRKKKDLISTYEGIDHNFC